MKVVQINSVYGFLSTGTIAKCLSDAVVADGGEAFAACRVSSIKHPNVRIVGNRFDWKLHALLTRIFGEQAYFSRKATKKMLTWIEEIKPDVVHLHNLHDNYINLNMLCDFIADRNIPTVMTLHDCWPFTGKCWYFSAAGCEKWQKKCGNCPMIKSEVPSWFFDRTEFVQKDRCAHLNSIPNLTLVGCSNWITNLAKQSKLGNNNTVTIHNGIDLNEFKPIRSRFRYEHGIKDDEHMVLGVSALWSRRKGADVFNALASMLPDGYKIVLVGAAEEELFFADTIIRVDRTDNRQQLAEIYTAADVFVNPTREEVLGLVNIESLACGTPVITFNTGGSPECIDETCGIVVEQEDTDSILSAIEMICTDKRFSEESCRNRAEKFSAEIQYKEYCGLYNTITEHYEVNTGPCQQHL